MYLQYHYHTYKINSNSLISSKYQVSVKISLIVFRHCLLLLWFAWPNQYPNKIHTCCLLSVLTGEFPSILVFYLQCIFVEVTGSLILYFFWSLGFSKEWHFCLFYFSFSAWKTDINIKCVFQVIFTHKKGLNIGFAYRPSIFF